QFLRKTKSALSGRGCAVLMESLESRCLLSDTGTITGHIWWDTNGNGLPDPGEAPRVYGSVYLDSNSDGAFEPGEPLALTNASGNYQFTGLAPGSYTIRHLVPTDSVLSYPQPPSSDFNIELNFADDIPQNIRDGIQQAADRWQKIVIGDLPDEGDIDDLKIDVVSGQLGLDILATGGPDQFRTLSKLPYHGVITWS